MLMNNLHPDVAERPDDLIVYGGIGKAARDWACYEKIVETLIDLEANETLIVQSGKPVFVAETHPDAPRVLIANSNLVPHWSTWEQFNELDRAGLMMFGQMTAGSWIYIGSQGIVQGTYETFVEMGRQHFDGDLTGRWILTAGLGGMGGAQPLAASMAGACSLTIECQESRIDFRQRTGYLDEKATSLDDAIEMIRKFTAAGEAKSIGLLGNAAEILPMLLERNVIPDAVTDQTSAHDPAHGYLPIGWTVEQWLEAQKSDTARVMTEAKRSMAVHVSAMLEFHRRGVPVFDYGNNIRQVAKDEGVEDAFDFSGFCAGLHSAVVLPRHRAFSLGGTKWRSGRYLQDRSKGQGTHTRRSAPPPLARHGAGQNSIPGAARSNLLGRTRPTPSTWSSLQRNGCQRRAPCASRHWSRPSGQRIGSQPKSRNRSHERRK